MKSTTTLTILKFAKEDRSYMKPYRKAFTKAKRQADRLADRKVGEVA